MPTACEVAFTARYDLTKYEEAARALFTLLLRFDIEDIDAVADQSLIDHPLKDKTDDKKCDLVYLDREAGILVVAQAYESRAAAKQQAKANKASDLNTATSWLLAHPIEKLPLRLANVAHEVRAAIGAGDIDTIEYWYVHNLPESDNVKAELGAVETSVRNHLVAEFGKADGEIRVAAIEVGASTQMLWYESLSAPVLVGEEIRWQIRGAFEVSGDNWSACVTAVHGATLHTLYGKHGPKLFSANYRDFLGVLRRGKRQGTDINSLIQASAQGEPKKFWVYNNGITVIVLDYSLERDADKNPTAITVKGISIVNGAQTTGAIGSLPAAPSDDALVPVRFIRCTDAATVANIVRYNNSQNPLLPADAKSNDAVQRRLRAEFQKIAGCAYTGGRRGEAADRIAIAADRMAADTCAQALAAFHQRPDLGYHRKSDIWRVPDLYRMFFNEQTSAGHVLFAYALLQAVDAHKQSLRDARDSDEITPDDEGLLDVLRMRGASLLLVTAIARSLDTILGTRIPNPFTPRFVDAVSRSDAVTSWLPIVQSLSSFAPKLKSCCESGIREKSQIDLAAGEFSQAVNSVKVPLKDTFKSFAQRVVYT